MVVEKFGSGDVKEIEDLPVNYDGCRYCYAASKTCNFYQEGDTHFLRVESELREVTCMQKARGAIALSCRPVTEAEARKLLVTFSAYN